MAKAAKSTRKFAASGQLKKTIQNRKKHQLVVKKAAGRRGAGRQASGKTPNNTVEEEDRVVRCVWCVVVRGRLMLCF